MIETEIKIEMNPHYRPDAVSVQCGCRAFAQLPPEVNQILRKFESNGMGVVWRIQAQRRGESAVKHIHFVNKQLILRLRKHPSGIFPSYTEAREVADKMMATGLFEKVIVSEEHTLEGLDGA